MLPLTARPSWSQRALALLVLGGCVGAAIALAVTGGAPWLTWALLAVFGLASGWATWVNFSERWELDESGLHRHDVLARRLGRERRRHVRWDAVLSATEHGGRTWFLEIEGEGRWVLDHLDAHDVLRNVFESQGVSVHVRERPRLWRRGEEPPP